MKVNKIFKMSFSNLYHLYVQKVIKKNRTIEELKEVICWLTGYDNNSLQKTLEDNVDLEMFFEQAPKINPNSSLIKGTICGVRIEEIEEPLMQKIRYLDKLVDELANGKTMNKILRK